MVWVLMGVVEGYYKCVFNNLIFILTLAQHMIKTEW